MYSKQITSEDLHSTLNLQTKQHNLLTSKTNLPALNVFFTCLQFSNIFRHIICVIFRETYNIKLINFLFNFNYSPKFSTLMPILQRTKFKNLMEVTGTSVL